MCHILVQSECVRVGACVLFLYLPGKISCVSKKLPRWKEDYGRGIRLHILLEGFCKPQRRQNADSLDKLLSPCRRWPRTSRFTLVCGCNWQLCGCASVSLFVGKKKKQQQHQKKKTYSISDIAHRWPWEKPPSRLLLHVGPRRGRRICQRPPASPTSASGGSRCWEPAGDRVKDQRVRWQQMHLRIPTKQQGSAMGEKRKGGTLNI